MAFEILGFGREFKCAVQLVKADVIEIKRKPYRVFTFKDPSNFLDSLFGHTSVVVYVGKADADSEEWKAYYWEPTFEQSKKASSYRGGGNILPHGSLAVLDMENEWDLKWELERRAKETRRWIDLFSEITRLCGKIGKIDEDNEFARSDRFKFMNADELEAVLPQIKDEYATLSGREKAEIG